MNRLDQFLEDHFKTLYCFLVLGSAVFYLSLTIEQLVWFDETYTLALIQHSFSEICEITAADVHPPLYYLLLKIFSQPFGYSLFSAKLFSVLPYVLILAIGGRQLKKLFDPKTALLFMVLFLLFPYSMLHAVDVRMYSLAALFVFLNGLYAFRCYRYGSGTDWVLFTVFGTCAAYTHYFAMVSAGIIYGLLLLWLLVKKREALRRWLLACVSTALLYLPWLGCFLGQLAYKAEHEYWIEEITLKTIFSYAATLFSAAGIRGFALFLAPCYLIALICLLLTKRREDILLALSALAVPVGTIGVGVILSFLLRPIFYIRYVVPAIPLLVFFMAYAIGRIRQEAVVSALLTVALIGGVSHYQVTMSAILSGVSRLEASIYPRNQSYIPLNASFTEQYRSVDAFVLDSSVSGMFAGALAYFQPETMVYSSFTLGAENPFLNMVDTRSLHLEECNTLMLFVACEGTIPERFSDFEAQYVGAVDECGYLADAYILTRR